MTRPATQDTARRQNTAKTTTTHGDRPTSYVTKRYTIPELAKHLETIRNDASDATIIHCHGVFDLLHVGHIRHLSEAASLGDLLVVTITPDRYVNKGPGRPAFTEELRAEALAALDMVDHVAVNDQATAVDTIRRLKPHIYVKGPDYERKDRDVTGGIYDEESAIEAVGGRLHITQDVTFSSSNLINNYLPVFPPVIRDYLEGFKTQHTIDDVHDVLERARDLRVLVVGETILDEYQYCDAIGKASKEPVLVARYDSQETFAGGSLAVANHMAAFSDHVDLVTMLGDDDKHSFVEQSLNENIDARFIKTEEAPTIVKRRFVEKYLMQKLFEVYEMDDLAIRDEEHAVLHEHLDARLPDYDVVVAIDYGHGMIDRGAVQRLADGPAFLAINTQSNAGNKGYNTISKYPTADYISVARNELALDARNKRGDAREQVLNVAQRLDCHQIMITMGKFGSLYYHDKHGFTQAPALAHHVVDRIGAGDAVLSATSLAAKLDAHPDIIGFLGNVAGTEAVATVGNREALDRIKFTKHIETLMK